MSETATEELPARLAEFLAETKEDGVPCGGSVSFDSEGVAPISCEAWSEPQPLDDALTPVEAFAPELLPDSLRPWVMDVSERTQAPAEYVAVGAMVSLGATLGRKLAVRPRLRDDWHEFGNLWGAVIGPPSWMKSPALDEARRPLEILEAKHLESFELEHREWEADSEAAKVRRDGAKDRARKAARENKSFDKMDLVSAELPDEPKPRRLIVNDATVPALCDVLRANPDGVLRFCQFCGCRTPIKDFYRRRQHRSREAYRAGDTDVARGSHSTGVFHHRRRKRRFDTGDRGHSHHEGLGYRRSCDPEGSLGPLVVPEIPSRAE